MNRSLLASFLLVCGLNATAQTYFYIDQIVVQPQPATTEDDINIALIGGLASTGAYVVSATADVVGQVVTISIAAADPGGATVIVPHTETVNLGFLPSGTYTIAFVTQGVGDFASEPEHTFEVLGDGAACADLELVSVQWNAFTDTAIVVHVMNNSVSEIFDYPNFVLYDENGHTLAFETVNFFGIVGDSWHRMQIPEGVSLPQGPFNGTLELWTLFSEQLACSWSQTFNLCPPPPCATLIPNIQNLGGAIPVGTYSWSIWEEDVPVASGEFELFLGQEFDADTICLPPGVYFMVTTPNDPPTGGAPYFGVLSEGYISGGQQAISWDMPMALPFSFYEPCIGGTNDLVERTQGGITATVFGEGLRVQQTDGGNLPVVQLFDLQGRLLYQAQPASNTVVIPLTDQAQGAAVLRVGLDVLRVPIIR